MKGAELGRLVLPDQVEFLAVKVSLLSVHAIAGDHFQLVHHQKLPVTLAYLLLHCDPHTIAVRLEFVVQDVDTT